MEDKWKENVKPSIGSPRRNVYCDTMPSENLKTDLKSMLSELSLEESILSIENGLKNKKNARRLRYDIYMADENERK